MSNKKILLASKSPRRRDLLKALGFIFETLTLDIDETYPLDLKSSKVANFIAQKKMKALLPQLNQQIGISADTTVILDDKILQKPYSKIEAYDMLNRLSGRRHLVNTAVYISDIEKKTHAYSDLTKVFFKKLNPKEIEHYISTGQAFDKAGAYGIQDWIGMIGIEKIEGSYYTAMGLPLHWCYKTLKKIMDY